MVHFGIVKVLVKYRAYKLIVHYHGNHKLCKAYWLLRDVHDDL